VAADEVGQHAREHGDAGIAEAQVAGLATSRLLCRALGMGDVGEDAPRRGPQRQPRLAQRHLALAATEQDDAELALHRRDLLRERRLGNADAFGGAAEMQLLGQDREIAQLPQIEHSYPPDINMPRSIYWTRCNKTPTFGGRPIHA